MKKLSIITGLLFTAVIIFTVILINPEKAINQPNVNQIKVFVVGCEGCKDITYCVDGGMSMPAPSNPFAAEYGDAADSHTICVRCCGNRAGTMNFLTGDKSVTVNVTASGTDCQCGLRKK
ncbi:MAG: hypothetical protein LWX07_04485 [Bacteroidetes bacterium]|nr:hypothetical protein [Bacteroidota bacterium]